MGDDQQFCLRWNNHQSTLIQNFDTLLESGTLVDCTLAAEGKYLKAHKVVLSACSPYFEGLLSEHYDKHPVFILKDVKFKELKAMMDYMYRGEVNISQDQLTALLKAAESLQIKGLSDNRTGGAGSATTGKADTRPAKTASSTAVASSSSVDIPHASSGLTIEKNSKVPRQSLQQVSVSDLPEDSASPQLRGLSSREGSQSPTRRRKRLRRRSLGNDDTNSMENHEASNSSDVNVSAPALAVAPVADEKAHADPADSIGRSALMQQLTKPADEMLQIPIEKPEPSEEMIQPKSEYMDDQESVEDLTNLDDDMNDLNEMEQDNSRAGPSHDPSQHPGIASWHIAGDRSNASVVGAAVGPPGTQDEVFLAAHEAAQAQRDSQGRSTKRKRSLAQGEHFTAKTLMEPPQEIVSMMSLDFLEKHKEQSALDSAESDDESFGFHLLQPQPLRKDFSKHQFNANMDSGGYSKNRGYTFIDPEVQNLSEMSFGASSSNAPGKNGRFSRYSTVEETLLHYNQGKKIIYAAKNGSFTEQNRRAMIRILIDELTFVHDSCYPPTESKVALAKAIVTEFPLLKNAHSKLGYEHYYDTQSKVGFIEYRLFTVRKSLPPDKKRYHSARKDVASSVFGSILLTEDDLSDKIMWMMNSNATNMNKVYISNCLRETFPNRRAWISRERPEISEILGKYPRLFNYNGDMINEEFKLMFPKHEDNFRTQFNPFYTSRIVEYAKIYKFDCLKNKCDIEDSVLKSLLLLMDLLPVANSVKGKVKESEKRRHTNFPVCPAAFIEIVPEGTNVEQFIANKRRADCIASQPYLICVKGQPMQYFIQGDGWILHHDDTTSLIQTFDLFFKLTHVCNLEYSPVLQNFFSFVENFFYKINNNAKSLVTSLFINLCNIKFEN